MTIFVFIKFRYFVHIKYYLHLFNVIFKPKLEQKFIKKSIVVVKVQISFVYLTFFYVTACFVIHVLKFTTKTIFYVFEYWSHAPNEQATLGEIKKIKHSSKRKNVLLLTHTQVVNRFHCMLHASLLIFFQCLVGSY